MGGRSISSELVGAVAEEGAAGEVVGGLHGAGYLTGTGLGKAAVFGRVAGREAAG